MSSTELQSNSFIEISAQGASSNSNDKDVCRVINDPIYGPVTINSPCASEIMDLPEFQRLKKVLQHGITGLVACVPQPPVNRFDHSVGAMLLVKHVGGCEEAQLAALLHDVAHTALSHVLDRVYNYVVHENRDKKNAFLDKTNIRQVLVKHGFDPDRVLQEENFSLLEVPKPDICADRLDYALRDSVSFGFITIEEAQNVVRSTLALDGHMVLDSVSQALILANAYLDCDQYSWANPAHEYLYDLTSQAIKQALDLKKINEESLWQMGDEEFWAQLSTDPSPSLQNLLNKINNRCQVSEWSETDQIDPELITCSFQLTVRTIDPLVKTPGGVVKRLSALDSEFAGRRQKYIKSREVPQTFVVKYLPPI